ncbi:MAG: preprotein translocase subunit YajC [Aminobacteriaceae bacterium]|uniref:preprotein translocase subunit YajC n=1 Tax=Aminivibrio sp. TaxID=1872489 RepID=UPI002A21F2F3|nr:preprotein translocase subunit YajC [Synergistaceae bacterium]MDD3390210.1 preprotein translocase subunit YajC [Synergistaceae bacterium]MDD4021208.1 preprotein translocase subunit YajC [Synergistaceae bacterium]MDD4611839.1 preprotein translocase subunit YajC [Synergistaceae bacterium]
MEQQCGQAAGGQGSLMGMLFPLAIFVVIFYFFIIRPQKKRQRAQDQLLASLTRGDQVVTIGGFFATIREVKEDSIVVEIADGVKVRILKSAVATKRTASASQPRENEPVEEKQEESN